ncbi:hypothetical protein GALMADRAFT_766400 [Galerina marginata CBS 339.88]|uniref:Uncharacterized protein n=1 Tax=Galerina marginata (strain CBS 339.88) TaxID=685588 RepID=A0A067SMT6_GALM3|nr:hypothetical protein GALMADRAFT_766400 [Galerina marginata CBS 339.88]
MQTQIILAFALDAIPNGPLDADSKPRCSSTSMGDLIGLLQHRTTYIRCARRRWAKFLRSFLSSFKLRHT